MSAADSRTPAQRAGDVVRAAEAAAAAARAAGPAAPPRPQPPAAADATAAPPGGLVAAADELDAHLARARSQLDALEIAVDRIAPVAEPGH